jgi:hypothetical protein
VAGPTLFRTAGRAPIAADQRAKSSVASSERPRFATPAAIHGQITMSATVSWLHPV